MKLYVEREIYNTQLPYVINQDEIGELALRIVPEYDEVVAPDENDEDERMKSPIFPLEVAFIAGIVGILACTLVFTLYLKRRHAKHLVEVVERAIFLRKIRKVLIKKHLYVEYADVRLETKLGDGNFGEVYRALVKPTKDSPPQAVAIKRLKKGKQRGRIHTHNINRYFPQYYFE